MFLTRILIDVLGHSIQILPLILMYFMCVPEERFRFSARTTVRWFLVVFSSGILLSSAAKILFLQAYPSFNPDLITFAFLILDFLLMMIVTRHVVYVHAGPNAVIILLGFFWMAMMYTMVNLLLIAHPRSATYDGWTLLAYAVITLFSFPVMRRLMVPYAKEYLLTRNFVRPQVKIIIFIMAIISIVQLLSVSRHTDKDALPLLSLMSVCIMVVYMLLIRYVVVEERRTGMELQLLTSQIGPHFILNTLNAISNLVDEDRDATMQAIYDFSGYLRMNFEALDKNTPVPFTEELEHVRFYLSIEKLRFREELEIDIDTPVTDFMLPALTVQPMVENAVRHGLRAKEGVGTLHLATRETDQAYEIVIRDDGAGFYLMQEQEAAAALQNHSGHYGIVNVRSRLARMVNGTLLIESLPGLGTTVTIQIPKKKGPLRHIRRNT